MEIDRVIKYFDSIFAHLELSVPVKAYQSFFPINYRFETQILNNQVGLATKIHDDNDISATNSSISLDFVGG